MANRFGGVGVTLPLNQLGTNAIALQAGEAFYIPSGTYNIQRGPYSAVQLYDPVAGIWGPVGSDGTAFMQVDSDGNNYRVVNQSGCPVAAVLSAAGAGYTSAPTVTASAGGSSWTAIMGSVVSTAVTIPTGGSNYTYPPAVIFSAPPTPGIPATGYATISAGAVTAITVTNQGAGYLSTPFVTLLNDQRDTTGANATAVATLTGSGTVTGLICTNHGTAITSGTVPSLTFAGGGYTTTAAGTIIMNWAVTSYAVTAGGAGYTGAVQVSTLGAGTPTIAPAYTNPNSQASFFRSRPASIYAALSGGAVTATGQVVVDGGAIGGSVAQSNLGVVIAGGTATTVATLTLGVGGVSDYLRIQAG